MLCASSILLKPRAARGLRMGEVVSEAERQVHQLPRLPISVGNAAGASLIANGRGALDAKVRRSGSL
jgi:hypothetical protein